MLFLLETFRRAFALVIVLYHLKINTFTHTSNFISNGGLVVDFFFILTLVIFLSHISLHYFESKFRIKS